MKKAVFTALALGAFAALPSPSILADAASVATTAVSSDASQHGPGRLFAQLDLSDTQEEQIAAIRAQTKAQFHALMPQMHAARKAAEQAVTDQLPLDEATVKLQALQALEAQMGSLRYNEKYQIGAVLTADQRTQLASLKEEMMRKWRHHGPSDS